MALSLNRKLSLVAVVGLVSLTIGLSIQLQKPKTEQTKPAYAVAVVQDGGLLSFSVVMDGTHVIAGDGNRTVFYTIGKDGKATRTETGPTPAEAVKRLVESAEVSNTILANPSQQTAPIL